MTRSLVLAATLAVVLAGVTGPLGTTGLRGEPAAAGTGSAAGGHAPGVVAGTGRTAVDESGGTATGYRSPTASRPVVLRPFDHPARPWLAGHRGVDLAMPVGAEVHAAGSGIVVAAGPVAGRPVVSVAHPDGLRTTYEPVSPAVRPGDAVRAGDVLGVLAAPGHCGDGCLHWGVRRAADDYVDPMLLLGRVTVRLYPSG
jgi:murein DD-endopeptidase MepM/ murein hydrolase activator NlpD